jgi:hypothetical protein
MIKQETDRKLDLMYTRIRMSIFLHNFRKRLAFRRTNRKKSGR